MRKDNRTGINLIHEDKGSVTDGKILNESSIYCSYYEKFYLKKNYLRIV